MLFYLHVQVWWALWDLGRVETWSQPHYYLALLLPSLMFALTEMLLPMASGPDTDWPAHFRAVRAWFYGIFAAFVLSAVLASVLLMEVPLMHPYRLIQFTMLAIVIAGMSTTNLRVHRWLAAGGIVDLLVGQVAFRLLPGLA